MRGDAVRVFVEALEQIVAQLGNARGLGAVGKTLATVAKKAGVDTCVFDRGGYLYHGRVKALADAAREGGLEF